MYDYSPTLHAPRILSFFFGATKFTLNLRITFRWSITVTAIRTSRPIMPYLRCPLSRVRILSVHIDQNHIAAQPGECFIPSLPHDCAGQKAAFSSATHEPFQRGVPALPCHNAHDTSWYSPSIARRPAGKKACGAPERSHKSKLRLVLWSVYFVLIEKVRTHCMDTLNSFFGLLTVWPHQLCCDVGLLMHKLLTFTMMVFPNGPWKLELNGSAVAVIWKQRPQASPKLWLEPNASSFTALVNPEVKFTPHAAEGFSA